MKRFKSNPKHYEFNMRDSQTAAAVPAALTSPDGEEMPGVAIMTNNQPRLVLTAKSALKIAHEIAYALEKVRKL